MRSLIVFIAVLLLSTLSIAQRFSNPGAMTLFNKYKLCDDSTYANSAADTLPNTTGFKAGGVSQASVTLHVLDSAKCDIYGEYQLRGTTTWTAGLTDSLISTVNGGKYQEYILRDNSTEKLGGTDVVWRLVVVWRAAGNGVSSATYDAEFNWKP